jgi:thioredoxin reductase
MNPGSDHFDAIIVGGSHAGLSAALTLLRSRRRVLILDTGIPCNKPSPHAHNFLTRDGESPAFLRSKALEEIFAYPGLELVSKEATAVRRLSEGLEVRTIDGQVFTGAKLLFATGIFDVLPGIAGFSECWGKSVLHCPYCHGYEVRDQQMAVIASNEHAYHLASLLANLTGKLTLFTNGEDALPPEHRAHFKKIGLPVNDKRIVGISHDDGRMNALRLEDGSEFRCDVAFAKVLLKQHCPIPENMGCAMEGHLIRVDDCQKTSIPHVFAAGDNSRLPRTISLAVAAGTQAGFMMNWELTSERLSTL